MTVSPTARCYKLSKAYDDEMALKELTMAIESSSCTALLGKSQSPTLQCVPCNATQHWIARLCCHAQPNRVPVLIHWVCRWLGCVRRCR